jgi:hypothetical protein
LQAPTGGTLDISLVDPQTGVLRATVTRPELERLVRRGCRAHPPKVTRSHQQQGPGHPGSPGDCGCAVLDRPPPVDRYEPTPAQRRFIKARDRTCRHP